MVKNLLFQNAWIKIRKSSGRFMSLLLVLLVGVGFFAGIRQSVPDIIATVTRYARAHDLMDFQVVSTMGLTDADVAALRSLDRAAEVVPSYSLDVLQGSRVVRVLALESSVNTTRLLSGRMPRTDTECVADGRHYKLGAHIALTGDAQGHLKSTDLTVVGLVQSPLFMSASYGSTTVGDGKLASFLFVRREAFTMEAYTQIYLLAKGAGDADAFSAASDRLTGRLKKELLQIKPAREEARYQEIYNQAADKIRAGEETIRTQQEQGERQLAEAKATLDANSDQLTASRRQLAAQSARLNKSESEQETAFQNAQSQITAGRAVIQSALQQAGVAEPQLDGKITELQNTLAALKAQQSRLTADSTEYARLGEQIAQLSASCEQLDTLRTSIRSLDAKQSELDQGEASFRAQIAAARQQIAVGQAKITAGQKELDAGYETYRSSLADFQTQTAAAQTRIQQAKDKLSTIEKPQWTILSRTDTINGYGDLKAAMKTITSIAAVLPLFFILIVILMTSNTMARMIAEQRGELGTLASLGFTDGKIFAGYLFYVLTATVLGAAGGYFLGCALIPQVVYSCFPYVLPALTVRYSPAVLAGMLGAAIALMTAVTVFFCRRELREEPAGLMRPISPPSGKKILLERVGPVWRRLSFTWKVTMRNLFRYKQRALMTVVGVAGCTALLMAGFGIRDCIYGVAEKQFGTLFRYADILVLKNAAPAFSDEMRQYLTDENVKDPALLSQTAVTCSASGKLVDAYLVVPEDMESFRRYFTLRDPATGAAVAPGADGAVISRRLADIYHVAKGGTLRVTDSDGHEYSVPVTGVTENYIQNYIYVTPQFYAGVYGKAAAYNMVVSGFTGDKTTLAGRLIGSGRFVSVSFTDDILAQAEKETASLGGVVVLLIGVATLLAVIVLYNLTSINISERTREIATLKVLGFRDGETNSYIYREAMILTLIGIGVGLAAGVGLHHMVMGYIERDEYEYFRSIHALSYLWSCLIGVAIALMMQLVTYFSLQKVDMIESLKSVE